MKKQPKPSPPPVYALIVRGGMRSTFLHSLSAALDKANEYLGVVAIENIGSGIIYRKNETTGEMEKA